LVYYSMHGMVYCGILLIYYNIIIIIFYYTINIIISIIIK
jgi:hypothetical protein